MLAQYEAELAEEHVKQLNNRVNNAFGKFRTELNGLNDVLLTVERKLILQEKQQDELKAKLEVQEKRNRLLEAKLESVRCILAEHLNIDISGISTEEEPPLASDAHK